MIDEGLLSFGRGICYPNNVESEWSTYELEDIVWDEFGESDDSIVPHPGPGKEDACGVNAHHTKNPCIELASFTERSGGDIKSEHDAFDARNGTRVCSDTKGEPSLTADDTPWPENVLIDPNCSGSISKAEVLVDAGKETLDKDGTLARALIPEFPNGDPILKSQIPMNYSDLCHFSLTDISTTETDLELFASELEDEESTTFLGYGWPNIGNFEDVDKMFRNCDATYGQQTGDNVDLDWTSSSSLGIDATDANKSFLGYSDNLSQLNLSYEENLNACPEKVTKSAMMRKSMKAGAQRTLAKCQSRSAGKKKNISLEHSAEASTRVNGLIIENQSPGPPPSKTNTFPHVKAPEIQSSRSRSLTYMGAGEARMHLGYNYSHHDGVKQSFTCAKPDGGRHASLTIVDAVPKASGMTPKEKIEKLRRRQKMRAALSMMQQHQELHSRTTTTTVDHSPVQKKQAQEVHAEGGDQTKVEIHGIDNTIAEVNSFAPQPSCMSSFVPDENSLEQACLHQLKDAITQLHDDTKLFIRDSLYRLARNAMERHNVGDSSSCSKTNKDKNDGLGMGGPTTAEKAQSNRCDGLINMETVTNPIDRAVAHLLFHKPNDISRQTVALPLETHIMDKIQQSWMLPAYRCCSANVQDSHVA